MKKGKEQWLRFSTRMMSGALALLGLTACDSGNDPGWCEYGTPYAKYEIKGKVTDEAKKDLSGARIIVKKLQGKSDKVDPYARIDTLKTAQYGTYTFKQQEFPGIRYRVVCEDPSDILKADSTEVQMKPKGGEGWYAGSDTEEVNFELKKK